MEVKLKYTYNSEQKIFTIYGNAEKNIDIFWKDLKIQLINIFKNNKEFITIVFNIDYLNIETKVNIEYLINFLNYFYLDNNAFYVKWIYDITNHDSAEFKEKIKGIAKMPFLVELKF